MPNSKKTVRFDHFKPYFYQTDENGNANEAEYNLSKLFQDISSVSFAESKKTIAGEIHMFHVCKHHTHSKIWEIQILRLREKILPGIADAEGSYELIRLGEFQYPAESTTLLYDEHRNILFMQRNVFGVSIKSLEEYLQHLSPDGTLVLLKPIIPESQIGKIGDDKYYRSVILVADSKGLDEQNTPRSLWNVLKTFSKYQGRIVKFELGFGRHRTGILNASEITQLVKEAYDFPSTHTLRVKVSDYDDTAFETIDLMKDRASFQFSVEYSRQMPITHERLFALCYAEIREDLLEA